MGPGVVYSRPFLFPESQPMIADLPTRNSPVWESHPWFLQVYATLLDDPRAAEAAIAPYGDALSIAALNGPRTTLVAGRPDALTGLVAALEADPFVRELIERFDATLVESTVKPL